MNIGLYNLNDVFDVKYALNNSYPQGMFIPKDHHYNANNKRKKGKKK